MCRAFKERGCTVVGVEVDPELAERARAYCDKVVVGDLDSLDLVETLGDERFDVVVCADILEHLRDPARTLFQVRSLLAPDGFVVASIPAITHVSVALELLKGNFDYRPLGLLDKTHARFFSKRGVIHLFERAGFWICELDRVYAAPHQMELAQPLTEFGPELLKYVSENDEAVTYQFIVKAKPFSQARELERLHSELEELRARVAELEPAVFAARESGLRMELEAARENLRDVVGARTQLAEELERVGSEAARLREELVSARAREATLIAELEAARRQLSEEAGQRGRLLAETDALARRLEDLNQRLSAADREMVSLRDRAAALIQANRSLRDELQRERGRRTSLEDEIAREKAISNALPEQLRQEMSLLRAELIEIIRQRPLLHRFARRLLRLAHKLSDLLSLPRHWLESVTQREYRPRLTPLYHLESRSDQSNVWRSTGNDPQLRLEPPLPWGWVEAKIRGSADPAAGFVMYVDRGSGFDELDARPLGLFGPEMAEVQVLLPFRRARAARLDPGSAPGIVRIDELVLKRVGLWRVAWRALQIYLSRQPTKNRRARLFRRILDLLLSGRILQLRQLAAKQLQYDIELRRDPYQVWLEQHRFTPRQLNLLRAEAKRFEYSPRISVLVPVYNADENWLRNCIESVLGQAYENWELCLADDASTLPYVRRLLGEYAKQDARIKCVFRERNGHISAATNSALRLATGEYIALLDQDDELSPDALFRVVELLNRHPDADLVYSDEDKIDESGRRHDPYFKPSWSPETLLAQMYVGHLAVYRRSLVEELGGFREGYDGSQDFDLALRVTERTNRVYHIPHVLYHWRAVPGSVAAGLNAKVYAYNAGQCALEDALRRRNLVGEVERYVAYPGRYVVHLRPDLNAKISIIIPTRDLAPVLDRCLRSVFERSTYPNFEVCVVDNGSRKRETLQLFRLWEERAGGRFRVVRQDIPFNFPRLVNAGVAATDGDLLLLLNNDTEVILPNWLDEMAGYAQRREIGAVGCKLLYPDGTVQHAGVILVAGVAGHSHKGYAADAPGYFGRLLTQINYAAVTGACLMIRRAVFDELGGFDEKLGVAFNDVDFCLRALRNGYRNVCLGHVTLIHHESKSRGYEDTREKQARFAAEIELMRKRWAFILDRDPYYSPHLDPVREDFSIAVRRLAGWRVGECCSGMALHLVHERQDIVLTSASS